MQIPRGAFIIFLREYLRYTYLQTHHRGATYFISSTENMRRMKKKNTELVIINIQYLLIVQYYHIYIF